MSLHDDIYLALRLLHEPLSSNTKPTEKEARAAARRVLEAVDKDYLSAGQDYITAGKRIFLHSLKNAIDPGSVPKTQRRIYSRAVDFRDATQGVKKARAVFSKDLDIAAEVYLRNKANQNGTSLVAKKYDKDMSEISVICAKPDVKWAVESCYGGITASDAAEHVKRYDAQEKTPSKRRRMTRDRRSRVM